MIRLVVNNFVLIVSLIGFFILLSNHLKVEGESNLKFKILLILSLCLAIFSGLEDHFSNLNAFNYERVFFSFICYSLRPFIVLIFISLLVNNKKMKYLYLLAFINLFIYSTAFFSDIAFSFSNDNLFQRGPLGYSTHIVCSIYLLIYILIIIKKYNKQNIMHTILLSFIALSCVSAAFLDFYANNSSLFDVTILLSLLIYYLFLYVEYTKKDILTKLNNRQSFYFDISDFNNISSVISIDMNDLKMINDIYGHYEGDNALVTVSNIFLNSEKTKVKFYRIGGDEFAALCFNLKESEVKDLIKKIKDSLVETKYSCSFGYAMQNNNCEDIYKLYKEADKKMYIEKEKYHKRHEKNLK